MALLAGIVTHSHVPIESIYTEGLEGITGEDIEFARTFHYRIKMLAIATEARAPEVSDMPTLKELGIDIVYAVNRGIFAPKGTPEAVLAKLEDACGKAAKDPAVTDAMKKQGTLVEFLNRKAYGDFLLKNDKINADLAQALGYKRK